MFATEDTCITKYNTLNVDYRKWKCRSSMDPSRAYHIKYPILKQVLIYSNIKVQNNLINLSSNDSINIVNLLIT